MMENEKGAGVAVISSGIDADSFGKIRMAGLMESKGLVVTVDGGKAVSCSGWGFTYHRNAVIPCMIGCNRSFKHIAGSDARERNPFTVGMVG